MSRICFAYGGKNPFTAAKSDQLLELHQTDFDRFTVHYGLSVKAGLSYAKAAAELGAAIMHLQASNSHLDNRTRKEATAVGDTHPYFEGL